MPMVICNPFCAESFGPLLMSFDHPGLDIWFAVRKEVKFVGNLVYYFTGS